MREKDARIVRLIDPILRYVGRKKEGGCLLPRQVGVLIRRAWEHGGSTRGTDRVERVERGHQERALGEGDRRER